MLDFTIKDNVLSGVAPEVKADTTFEINLTAERSELDEETKKEIEEEKQKIMFKTYFESKGIDTHTALEKGKTIIR